MPERLEPWMLLYRPKCAHCDTPLPVIIARNDVQVWCDSLCFGKYQQEVRKIIDSPQA